MKIKVQLSSPKSQITLPIHYNHILKGFITANLIERGAPLTFSNIFGQKRVINRKIIFKSPCHFYLSTVEPTALKGAPLELLNLGKNSVKVERIEVVPESPEGAPVKLKTLSPITVFQKLLNGKTFYFSPEDDEFYALIREDLTQKVKKFLGREVGEVEIKPAEDSVFKKAVIQYRNRFVIEAWKGVFELQGPKEAIEAALKLGLGYRNPQGFGMVAISG